MNINRSIHVIFPILFIAFVFGFLFYERTQKPRVLVLHSYSDQFSWVKGINRGIKTVFEKHPYITVRTHYMDTKRQQFPGYFKTAAMTAKTVINQWKPDVIISLDDNAQELVAKDYVNKADVNIVFAGINASLEKYGYKGAKNVTGILEGIPYEGAKEVLKTTFGKKFRKLYHISDNSITSQYVHDEVVKYNWSPYVLVKSVKARNIDEWKRAVKEAAKMADLIILTHYQTVKTKDEKGKVMNINEREIIEWTKKEKELIEWTEKNTKIPAIGFFGFFVEDGGPMAIAVSDYEQGREAAKLAIEIIDKRKIASKIPIRDNRLFGMYFRISSFKKHFPNTKIPITYESMSKDANQYYE